MPRRAVLRIVLPGLAAAAGLGVALARGELPAAAALAGSFALGHAFPLRTTVGRLQPLSPAIAAAAALLGLLAPAAAGAAVGLPAGWLIARWRHGERASADVLPGEAAGMAAFSMVFGGLDSLLPDPGSAWMHLSLLVPAGNGTVTQVRVKVGPTTGPMQVVVLQAHGAEIDDVRAEFCHLRQAADCGA